MELQASDGQAPTARFTRKRTEPSTSFHECKNDGRNSYSESQRPSSLQRKIDDCYTTTGDVECANGFAQLSLALRKLLATYTPIR
jgi:hypothetical protein